MSQQEILEKLSQAVLTGNSEEAGKLAHRALDEKIDPYTAVMKGCAEGMRIVSDRYDKGEFYVPDVLVAAQAMNTAVQILTPHIKVEGTSVPGTVLLGVVSGDIHDIGKNLVKILLEAAGFRVIDLGKDVSAATFIEAVKEHKPDVVGMSTLMSPTMMTMQETIKEFKNQGVRGMVKIIVGGGPVSPEFAEEIGADGYEKDAPKAVKLVEKLMKGGSGLQ